ncbi:peptide chain release factor [Chloropicon primus]|uniref:Peptide chain release factor n=1 Tax=Chloropicon primus TaxID=1764295 RepID=A0A5B8MUM5_9CHLO|nr:peptide chain release factor [Chloropicon primus]UPR03480.1 peptide chain release factor [Chloropicon primus]|eukprot:QDZ24273.1 peptide chain release factor [Chloropicon primus]
MRTRTTRALLAHLSRGLGAGSRAARSCPHPCPHPCHCARTLVPTKKPGGTAWTTRRTATRGLAAAAGQQQGNGESLLGRVESLAGLHRELERVRPKVDSCLALLDREEAEAALSAKEEEAASPDLWEGSSSHSQAAGGKENAAQLLRDITALKQRVALASDLEKLLGDITAAADLLDLESEGGGGSEGVEAMLLEEAAFALGEVQSLIDRWEVEKLLEGRFDRYAACLSINAGAGGTDAQDWAQILQRMYTRWAERRGFKATLLEVSPGEEAGIKSCSMQIEGDFAFGFLCGEKGTHRLVRQSPFNAKAARQTSFAAVDVVPVIEDLDLVKEVQVDDKELEVTTMRSGGKGGQNVNKIESAVRIKHLPTGITVRCSEERSQGMNRAKALAILKSKLVVLEQEKRDQEMSEIRGEVVVADFGQQIRNYVFHPYKLIKDLRTGVETSGVDVVLDGDLDDFQDAFLNYRAAAS